MKYLISMRDDGYLISPDSDFITHNADAKPIHHTQVRILSLHHARTLVASRRFNKCDISYSDIHLKIHPYIKNENINTPKI